MAQAVKASAYNAGDPGSIPRSGRGRRKWQPTPVLLPGESHGWKSLVGYNTWGRKESDTTEQLHFHFHYSIRSLIENCYPIGGTVTMTIEELIL